MDRKERQLLKEALIPHLPEGWVAEGYKWRGPIRLYAYRYPVPNDDGFIVVEENWVVCHYKYQWDPVKKIDCSNKVDKIKSVVKWMLETINSFGVLA